jgi:regulator of replication initiation timing
LTTRQAWMLCFMLSVIALSIVFFQYCIKTNQTLDTANQEINELKEQLQEERQVTDTHIDELTLQVEDLRERSQQWDKQDRGEKREAEPQQRLTYLGEYNVTGYCGCEICCGEWAKDRPDGIVYGAAGEELIPGISVAGWLPLGSRIMIDGQEYIVQDRTAKRIRDKYDGKIIDIYCGDHQTAWDIGNEKHEVWLVE